MRTVKGSENLPYSSRRALVALEDEFQQRKIGKTGQSFRRLIPLQSPAGAQWVESDLEANAVIQIAFVPSFYDLITQPIIEYELHGKDHVYTPDIACIFHAYDEPFPARFVIETKPKDVLERRGVEFADRFYAAEEMCKQMGAAFRVLHEDHLDTAYLRNALLLRRENERDPNFGGSDLLKAKFGDQSFSRKDGEDALSALLPEQWERLEAMNVLIAWRELRCDLTKDLHDETEVWFPSDLRGKNWDPFLKMLQTMDSGLNI